MYPRRYVGQTNPESFSECVPFLLAARFVSRRSSSSGLLCGGAAAATHPRRHPELEAPLSPR